MSTTRELTDIPTEEEADEVVSAFKSAGCDPVTKTKQANGNWRVTATCPD